MNRMLQNFLKPDEFLTAIKRHGAKFVFVTESTDTNYRQNAVGYNYTCVLERTDSLVIIGKYDHTASLVGGYGCSAWRFSEGTWTRENMSKQEARELLIAMGVEPAETARLNNVNASKAKKWAVQTSVIKDDDGEELDTKKTEKSTKRVGTDLEFEGKRDDGKPRPIKVATCLSEDHNGASVAFTVYFELPEFEETRKRINDSLVEMGATLISGSVTFQ